MLGLDLILLFVLVVGMTGAHHQPLAETGSLTIPGRLGSHSPKIFLWT
jgi:hypothetical protein